MSALGKVSFLKKSRNYQVILNHVRLNKIPRKHPFAVAARQGRREVEGPSSTPKQQTLGSVGNRRRNRHKRTILGG